MATNKNASFVWSYVLRSLYGSLLVMLVCASGFGLRLYKQKPPVK